MVLVTFRKEQNGSILAVFGGVWDRNTYQLASYAHIGQHSGVCLNYYYNSTTPASPNEYKPLLNELKTVGYIGEHSLKIVKRLPIKKIFNFR